MQEDPETRPEDEVDDASAEEPSSDAEDNAVSPPPPLQDALAQVLRRIVYRGQQELERVASSSRTRLELRQMQRDLDHFWVRLGKTAYHLSKAGEIDHPGLTKAIERIDDLEGKIDARRGGDPVSEDD